MELFFGSTLGIGTVVLLVAALFLALGFEFVNGFHDTANAVATVIYTRSLTPTPAVVWSGCLELPRRAHLGAARSPSASSPCCRSI